MDITQYIILIRGQDKTSEVASFTRNYLNNKINIRYHGGFQSYAYNQANVRIFESPQMVDLNNKIAYIGDVPLYNPQCILNFGELIRIIEFNGKSCIVRSDEFYTVENSEGDAAAHQILEYLRDIAQYTTTGTEDSAFLRQELDRLTFIHPESVLGRYLLQKPIERRPTELDRIMFPFSFNLSQKIALEQALTNSISVIEGPPGTGKTQTILNILANLVAVQGRSVAVVSNNNEAVKNVSEKLEKKQYHFLTAFLGKKDNQDAFFSNMPIPDVEGWDYSVAESELSGQIQKWNVRLTELMNQERTKAKLEQELRAWKLEQEHFERYFSRQDVEEAVRLPLFSRSPEKILDFLAETSVAEELHLAKGLFYRIKLLFKFGVLNVRKLEQKEVPVLLSLQRKYYQLQIQKLEHRINQLSSALEQNSVERLKEMHQAASEKLFRTYLHRKYRNSTVPAFTRRNYKVLFSEFIKAYPILLSTTHALRRSIPQNYLLDYVIIDESSQVDLITGVLAFSCCRNVVIVGDLKQLPQITDQKIKSWIRTAPLGREYDYFANSILSSLMAVYGGKLPAVTLREHYRCHPQIIEFCNQKYYNGALIAYTKPKSEECPLILYKTVEGNHMRRVTRGTSKGVYNQREIDVIVNEILKNPYLEGRYEDIGIVTPYRKQADQMAGEVGPSIESDTVHKYQGREKNTIIMSTVLDSSWDGQRGIAFIDDPQMINVAVSRAIDKFVLVTDHDLFFKRGEHIGDLIRYMQYSTLDENEVESRIVSVFDLLYQRYSAKLLPLRAKMNPKASYQSEEALRLLLEEILEQPEYSRYGYTQGVLLQNLLNDTELLTEDEAVFVGNRASLDFVVFYQQDKSCIFAIEVDGFAFHENQPEQLRRDAMKDNILKKYNLPLLRLATNGSEEREKIEKMLDKQRDGSAGATEIPK